MMWRPKLNDRPNTLEQYVQLNDFLGDDFFFICVMTKCMDFEITISTVALTTLAAFNFFLCMGRKMLR